MASFSCCFRARHCQQESRCRAASAESGTGLSPSMAARIFSSLRCSSVFDASHRNSSAMNLTRQAHNCPLKQLRRARDTHPKHDGNFPITETLRSQVHALTLLLGQMRDACIQSLHHFFSQIKLLRIWLRVAALFELRALPRIEVALGNQAALNSLRIQRHVAGDPEHPRSWFLDIDAGLKLAMKAQKCFLHDVICFVRLQPNADQVAVERQANFAEQLDDPFTMSQNAALLNRIPAKQKRQGEALISSADSQPHSLHTTQVSRLPIPQVQPRL